MKVTALNTVVLGLVLGSAQADKDDSYYIAGTGNPNRAEKMYWKDAENIFQDLKQFQELHVEFHNCAWSWMQTSDDGNDIEENDYWYMGKIPPMGANVAFSLYGSLKGETFSGCGEDTFINSFYTNSGFTNFARAMNYAGISGFSSYTYDDDSYGKKYTAQCYGGYGVGCDYTNGFALHTYSGDECNPEDYTGVKDTLSSLNSAMQSAQCVQIYNVNTYRGSPYGTALELLAYSHSCFYQDFFSPDGVCPDPYGKLKYYQKQFYNGIQESKKQDPYQVTQRKALYKAEIKQGKIKTAIGLFLVALALVIMLFECLVACVDRREKDMRRYTPRNQDFIITARSKDEDVETPTVADRSDTDSENYVTMSDTYTPPSSLAPQAVITPPIQSPVQPVQPPQPPAPPAQVAQPPAPQPSVQAPTPPAPQLPAPPAQVPQPPAPQPPAPQEVRAPEPVITPSPVFESEVKVNAAPAVLAPVPIPPPATASPGNMVALKAEVQREEIITVFSPPCMKISEPKSKPEEADAEEIVPKPEVESQNIEPKADVEDVEPIVRAPTPEVFEDTEDVDEKKEQLEDESTEEKEVESEEEKEVESAEEKEDESTKEEEVTTSDVVTPDSIFSTCTEIPSSPSLPEVEAEAPAVSSAQSMRSISSIENPQPLFADIPQDASQREDDAASVPSLDEIIASREFDSDSDDEMPPPTTTEVKPESNSNFSQQAPSSQYFDAEELEAGGDVKDEIELCREAHEEEESSEEQVKETAQPEAATIEEPKQEEQPKIERCSSAPVTSQNNEEEEEDEQEVAKAASWYSFTI